MNYEVAMAEARRGRHVTRQCWCWLYVTMVGGVLSLVDESSGTVRSRYGVTSADRKATDWVVVL